MNAKKGSKTEIHEGQDPEIKRLRDKIPEPADYGNFCINVFANQQITGWHELDEALHLAIRKTTFERILIRKPGVVFWAWICTEDGCYYF